MFDTIIKKGPMTDKRNKMSIGWPRYMYTTHSSVDQRPIPKQPSCMTDASATAQQYMSIKKQDLNTKFGISLDNPMANQTPYCEAYRYSRTIHGQYLSQEQLEKHKNPYESSAGLGVMNSIHKSWLYNGHSDKPKMLLNMIEMKTHAHGTSRNDCFNCKERK